ncbi:unnamed protein product, partial [Thelazia callipaeda]|uniref:Uncharacterized protein n=1 Tax=Thelazia callipaeda TaxID=103827 RepID=A0A0N5DCG4_THECL
MWQISVQSSTLYFYSLTLLAILTRAKNETTERININDRQIARSDDSDFIAKRLREALSVGRATVSETAEELTTATNPNGNNIQRSLSQGNGRRQIYNDPSADLPSHRHNSYDYNLSQIAEKNFHSTNLPESVFPIFLSTFWQIYENYTTAIANSQNSIAEENVARTTQSSPVQALISYYGYKLANFNEAGKMISTNTQSFQSEIQERCMRSLNYEKAIEKKRFQCPVCEQGFQYQ